MMKELKEKELEFVARFYDRDRYDSEKAIERFHKAHKETNPRRWWMTAAAAAASVAIAFAAGYSIHMSRTSPEAPAMEIEHNSLNPDVAQTHVFVYDAAPLPDVLSELSSYYDCTLKTDAEGKLLTATFPDDDIFFIVSLIEEALDISISIEK